jgi:hypothetical protein
VEVGSSTSVNANPLTELTDKEFQDRGDHIRVTFLTRKNYQMGNNSVHVIQAGLPSMPCAARQILLQTVQPIFPRVRFAG